MVAAGLFVFGFGNGAWDVAMNVQGAAVERELGRAIMPRFHAGWSIGTVAGAGVGAVMVALHVPVTVHVIAVALAIAVAVPIAARRFLPPARTADHPGPVGGPPRRRALAAWTDPRTLLIGLFVLCMAFTEGTGNDWLSLGVIDGYHTVAALGTLTFALFLAAMTAGRWFGPALIDRYGRVRVLRVCARHRAGRPAHDRVWRVLPVALAGAIAMGLGTSLGFPVGLSSAADDPGTRRAPGEHRRLHRLPGLPGRAAAGRLPRRPGRGAAQHCDRRRPDRRGLRPGRFTAPLPSPASPGPGHPG